MKQKFIFIIVMQIFFSMKLFAQIPNADFESWSFWGWYYNPDSWNTNNSQISSSFVQPDSDAYIGNLAMNLYNYGSIKPVATTTFVTSNNINTLNAYVKLKVIYNDTVSIVVREFYNGVAVDSGIWIGFSDMLNYSPAIVSVSQNSNAIDSVEIEISGGNQTNLIMEGTSFLVDDLQLNTTGIIIDDPIVHFSNVYPNPVTDMISIEYNDIVQPSELKIFNSTGALINKYWLNNDNLQMPPMPTPYGQFKIDVSKFEKGFYVLQLNTDSTTENYKFIKQ
ncbi:MAG: T9SS type A sorting domain-containing protein [Bacteroidia bacterium]